MTHLLNDNSPRMVDRIAELRRELTDPAVFPTLAILAATELARAVAISVAVEALSGPAGARAGLVVLHLELAADEFSDATGFDADVDPGDTGGRFDSATQIAVRGLLDDCTTRIDTHLDSACSPPGELLAMTRALLHLDAALRTWPAGQPLDPSK